MKIDNKKKIKVIKKDDIGVVKERPVIKKDKADSKRKAMVSTISEWVDDLQKRRLKEAKASVDRIYKQYPQNA